MGAWYNARGKTVSWWRTRMNVVTGTYKNGSVVLDAAADWPAGHRVVVASQSEYQDFAEDPQADDRESVARWIAEFDAIPPLQMTPTEEAEWQAARLAQREMELSKCEERAGRLKGL